ncbi:glycoside hydrolase [Mycena metata]|uniref:mannosyl-oligosaccharide 1,2-alpha-mannosidase n=1 Tax=Mycena metata TaxID=1033252 RepID=A0AAD7N563_9AGAR|nr:glycoside hydrolase [Mycena metata]
MDVIERDAMGSDEYHPISHRGQNLSHSGGIGYTVVDALDTMLLMGLHDEYSRASDWVRNSLSFERDGRTRCFNTFEVWYALVDLLNAADTPKATIRVLGGLLSTLHLSADEMYLRHAVDLADDAARLRHPSGAPALVGESRDSGRDTGCLESGLYHHRRGYDAPA